MRKFAGIIRWRGWLAAAILPAGLSLFAAAPSVFVAELDRESMRARVSFPAADRSRRLYFCCDSVDRGENCVDWPSANRRLVAEVPAGTAYAAVALPEAWNNGAGVGRFFFADLDEPPDVIRLDYIQGRRGGASNIGAHLMTGLHPTQNSAVTIDFSITALDTDQALFCARTGAGVSDLFAYFISGTQAYYYFCDRTSPDTECGLTAGIRYVLKAYQRDSWIYKQNDLSTVYTTISNTGSTSVPFTSSELVLFKAGTPSSSPSHSVGTFRLHSFELRDGQNGPLLADFVPASSNGVAGVYDSVSGRFIFSGDADYQFIPGNVVDERPAFGETIGYSAVVSGADASAIRVDAVDDLVRTATVSFVAADIPRRLYFCCGRDDAGEDCLDWASSNRYFLAEIDAGAVSATVELPSVWGVTAKTGRFFFADVTPLPVDAILDYIQGNRVSGSDGAYLMTGLRPNRDTWVEMDLTLTTLDPSQALFCSRTGSGANDRYAAFVSGTVSFYDFCDKGAPDIECGFTAYTRYLFKAYRQNMQIYRHSDTATVYKTISNGGNTSTYFTGPEMSMFVAGTPSTSPSHSIGSYRLHGFVMRDGPDGQFRADYVPALSNGVAGVYDRVSGRFLASSNADRQFIAGNVVETNPSTGVSIGSSALLTIAAPIAIDVVSLDNANHTATVSFAAADRERRIYFICADRDYGDALAAWPMDGGTNSVTVAAGATSVTMSLPSTWGVTASTGRFFFGSMTSYPIDECYNYVQPDRRSDTEGSYIVTGLELDEDAAVEVDLEVTSTGYNQSIYCARTASDTDMHLALINKAAGEVGYYDKGGDQVSDAYSAGTRYILKTYRNNGYLYKYASSNTLWKTLTCSATSAPPAFTSPGLAIFMNGRPSTTPTYYAGSWRLYGFKVRDGENGPLLADYLPAAKNGSVGLYDRVSGEFIAGGGRPLIVGTRMPVPSVTTCDGVSAAVATEAVSVKQIDNFARTAVLEFAPRGETVQVYLACADRDYGDNPDDWPSECLHALAMVGPDDTSAAVMLPTAWGCGASVGRFMLLRREAPPVDACYDYIQADRRADGDGSYLLTGLRLNQSSEIELDFKTASTINDECLYCSRTTDSTYDRHLAIMYSGGRGQIGFWNGGCDPVNSVFSTNTRYIFRSYRNTARIYWGSDPMTVRNTLTFNMSGSPDFTGPGLTLFMNGVSSTSPTYYAGGWKLYGFKVRDGEGGPLVADYLPARSNGVVGVYDRVSGRFLSSGGRPFLVGNEIPVPVTITAYGSSAPQHVESIAVERQSATNRTMNVVFPAPGRNCTLYFASGDADCGEDISDWPAGKTVALKTVGADDVSAEVTLPEGWCEQDFYGRFFFAEETAYPVDVRYDYIQGNRADSSNGSYLLTGLKLNENSAIEIEFTTASSISTECLYCSRSSGDSDDRHFLLMYANGNAQIGFWNGGCDPVGSVFSANTGYLLKSYRNNAMIYQLTDTNTLYKTLTYNMSGTPDHFTGPGLTLFMNGVASTNPSYSPGAWKLRAFRLRDGENGPLLADYMPAGKDGVAGVYDRVSGRFLSSGDSLHQFIAGNELPVPTKWGTYACSPLVLGGDEPGEEPPAPTVDKAAKTIRFAGAVDPLRLGTTELLLEYGSTKELGRVYYCGTAEAGGDPILFDTGDIFCDYRPLDLRMRVVRYRYVFIETLDGQEIGRFEMPIRFVDVCQRPTIFYVK